jgi:hypothetical protein
MTLRPTQDLADEFQRHALRALEIHRELMRLLESNRERCLLSRRHIEHSREIIRFINEVERPSRRVLATHKLSDC